MEAPNSKFSSTITKYQSEVIVLSDTDNELLMANNSSTSGVVTSNNRGIQRQLSILSSGSYKTNDSGSIFNASLCSNLPSVEEVDSFYK
ncbi:6148_t:CDS:2, partial [Dentiscutata erythropus]